MLASELIEFLEKLIDENGDLPVYRTDKDGTTQELLDKHDVYVRQRERVRYTGTAWIDWLPRRVIID